MLQVILTIIGVLAFLVAFVAMICRDEKAPLADRLFVWNHLIVLTGVVIVFGCLAGLSFIKNELVLFWIGALLYSVYLFAACFWVIYKKRIKQ